MKVNGVEMCDMGKKIENEMVKQISPEKTKNEKRYPTIEISENGYNTFDLDLGSMEIGDEVTIVMTGKVKEITERSVRSTDRNNEDECRGTIEIIKAGMKPVSEKIMNADDEKSISRKINEKLEKE